MTCCHCDEVQYKKIHCFNDRVVNIYPSAEVNCFTNVMLRANVAIDEIDAIVCAANVLANATRDRAFKTIRVGAVFTQKASDIGT